MRFKRSLRFEFHPLGKIMVFYTIDMVFLNLNFIKILNFKFKKGVLKWLILKFGYVNMSYLYNHGFLLCPILSDPKLWYIKMVYSTFKVFNTIIYTKRA